jgi:hypothetical protein
LLEIANGLLHSDPAAGTAFLTAMDNSRSDLVKWSTERAENSTGICRKRLELGDRKSESVPKLRRPLLSAPSHQNVAKFR